MAEIKKLLDDAIETEINNLNSASDKDEKSEVIKNLAALHKLRIEERKSRSVGPWIKQPMTKTRH